MGFLSGLLGGGSSKVNAPPTPEYYTDPNFDATQGYLKNYAEKGLAGDMPDWYRQIGEAMPGDILTGKSNSLTSDILGKANENAAVRGTGRGGMLSADTMGAIGNASASTRYSDWVRAMQGRAGLMNTFLGTEGQVGQNAYQNQTDKNSFDQWKYGADLAQEQRRAANAGAGISNLMKIGGGIAGFMAGGPLGSMIGSNIGGSINGGSSGSMDVGSLLKGQAISTGSNWLGQLLSKGVGSTGGVDGGADMFLNPEGFVTGNNNIVNPNTGMGALNFGSTSTKTDPAMLAKMLFGG